MASKDESTKSPSLLRRDVPDLCTILIWTCGVLLLIGICVNEVQLLILQYVKHNEGTKMSIISNNETMTPPLLTFCIPYQSMYLTEIAQCVRNPKSTQHSCDELADHFVDVRFRNTSIQVTGNATEDRLQISSFLVQELLKFENFKDILDAKNSAWNQPLIESVWDLFSAIGDLDNLTSREQTVQKYKLDHLLIRNSTLDSLFESIIAFVCEYIRIDTENGEIQCSDWFQNVQSHMFANSFCFKLLDDQRKITIMIDTRNIHDQQFMAWTDITQSFRIFSGTHLLSYPLGDIENIYALYQSQTEKPLLNSAHEIAILKYMIDASVSFEKPNTQCYWQKLKEGCLASCADGKRLDCYECIPFTFRKRSREKKRLLEYPDTPYCNSTHYSKTECDYAFASKCEDQCVRPCQYVNYRWQTIKNTNRGGTSRKFTLKIEPVQTPFVQFDLTERQTEEQLISSVAGLFNLFLGFSGVTLVNLIVEFMNFFKKWRKNRPSQGERSVENSHVANSSMQSIDARLRNLESLHEIFKQLDARIRSLERNGRDEFKVE